MNKTEWKKKQQQQRKIVSYRQWIHSAHHMRLVATWYKGEIIDFFFENGNIWKDKRERTEYINNAIIDVKFLCVLSWFLIEMARLRNDWMNLLRRNGFPLMELMRVYDVNNSTIHTLHALSFVLFLQIVSIWRE